MRVQLHLLLLVAMSLGANGCRATSKTASVSVEEAWSPPRFTSNPSPSIPAGASKNNDVIAVVDGTEIERSRVIDLLIEGHGVGVLEQLIVLDAAARLSSQRGLIVSQAHVDAEYARSLDKLLGDVASGDPDELRHRAGEALLEEMLAMRNVSRREFMIVTRRNAILRKIVAAEMSFDEEQLKQEYARTHGERVEIRHIQLGSRAEVDRVRRQLDAGVDFGELATRNSANRKSADRQGLLPPFTALDPDVPEVLRQTAFLLPAGQASEPILIDGWHHLVRVERRIPAQSISFEQARPSLERGLRERLADSAMQELYARLFQEAKIEILDPNLRAIFFRKHSDHRSATQE